VSVFNALKKETKEPIEEKENLFFISCDGLQTLLSSSAFLLFTISSNENFYAYQKKTFIA